MRTFNIFKEVKSDSLKFLIDQRPIKSIDNGASVFLVELKRVTFVLNTNVFEISFHLPHFSCYDIILKNFDDIKTFLNHNDAEWQTLINNLYAIGEYEYIQDKSDHSLHSSNHGYEKSIEKQLDLYFSTLSNFKLYCEGHFYSTAPLSSTATEFNPTSAINLSILNLMSQLK